MESKVPVADIKILREQTTHVFCQLCRQINGWERDGETRGETVAAVRDDTFGATYSVKL